MKDIALYFSPKRKKWPCRLFPLNSHTIPFWFRVIVYYRVTVCTPSTDFYENSHVLTLKNSVEKEAGSRKPVDFKGLCVL